VCMERLIPGGMLVDQMKEPCRWGWQFWNQSGPGLGASEAAH